MKNQAIDECFKTLGTSLFVMIRVNLWQKT